MASGTPRRALSLQDIVGEFLFLDATAAMDISYLESM